MNTRNILIAIGGSILFCVGGLLYYFVFLDTRQQEGQITDSAVLAEEDNLKEAFEGFQDGWPQAVSESPDGSTIIRYQPNGVKGCYYEIFEKDGDNEINLLTEEERKRIGTIRCDYQEAGGGLANPFYGWSEENEIYIKTAENKVIAYNPYTDTQKIFEYTRDGQGALFTDVDKTFSYFYFRFFENGKVYNTKHIILDNKKQIIFEATGDEYKWLSYNKTNHGFLLRQDSFNRDVTPQTKSVKYDFLSLDDFSIINILTTPYLSSGVGSHCAPASVEEKVGEFVFDACGSGIPSPFFEGRQYIIIEIPTSS